ncbi:MAG: hypothetical protein J6R02_01150, partial [Alistipes sp.]|nr:hypothetical protein [Alistipes sp.]
MRKIATTLLLMVSALCYTHAANPEYVVIASENVNQDKAWREVVNKLATKHDASILLFKESPCETMESLKKMKPRYVAVVDMPENIGRDYVIEFHHTSRDIDNDIYADFMWGIITGYDAEAAMRMVNNSTEPLVVKDAVATIMELNSAKWFDNYAWIDDHTKGLWGEKRGFDGEITTGMVAPEEVLPKFTELYA